MSLSGSIATVSKSINKKGRLHTSVNAHFVSRRAQQKSLTENNSLPGLQDSTQFND